MKSIYLIGFMGSGKSSVASELVRSSHISSVDTDDYIEEFYQEKIVDIFSCHGEEVFRAYEVAALKEVGSYDVVSTGGGIVESEENILTMKDTGVIFYLQASFEVIADRLQCDVKRPLWKHELQERQALYARRIKLYEHCADYIIETDNKSVQEVVLEINNVLKTLK